MLPSFTDCASRLKVGKISVAVRQLIWGGIIFFVNDLP
jgi:hypothetical protein